MTTMEFEQRLRQLAWREGMTDATFGAWLRQAGGAGRPGAA